MPNVHYMLTKLPAAFHKRNGNSSKANGKIWNIINFFKKKKSKRKKSGGRRGLLNYTLKKT